MTKERYNWSDGDLEFSEPNRNGDVQVKPSPFRNRKKNAPAFLTKDMSHLDETAGGALVPPPKPPREGEARQKDGDPKSSALERAKHSDLITLPEGITGTNCGNCKYVKDGYCIHPEVDQPVTERMCCAYWDAPGTKRAWEETGEKGIKGSYFETCERDDEGRCLPSGQQEEGKPVETQSQEDQRNPESEAGKAPDEQEKLKPHKPEFNVAWEDAKSDSPKGVAVLSNIPKPSSESEAAKIAKALRKSVMDEYGKTKHRCRDSTSILKTLFPDTVVYTGTIPTHDEYGGYHYIGKVGDFFIDVTGDQFGLGKVNVFTQEDLEEGRYSEYVGFRENQSKLEPIVGLALKAIDFYIEDAQKKESKKKKTPPSVKPSPFRNRKKIGQKSIKSSYFAECERDDEGRCLPSGQQGEEHQEERPMQSEEQNENSPPPVQEIAFHGTSDDFISNIKKEGIKPTPGAGGVAAYTTSTYIEAVEAGLAKVAGTKKRGVQPGDRLAVVVVSTVEAEKVTGSDYGEGPTFWGLFRDGVKPEHIVDVDVYDAYELTRYLRGRQDSPKREELSQFRKALDDESYVFVLVRGESGPSKIRPSPFRDRKKRED